MLLIRIKWSGQTEVKWRADSALSVCRTPPVEL